MKRAPKGAVYRLDPHRHAMNRGKEARVRALLRTWRRVATLEARFQWRHFFETGGFQTSGPARFADQVTARQHQMIRDQVVGQLGSWLGNRQSEFTAIVMRSSLREEIRHQLHTVNRWKAWFSREPLTMKDGTLVPAEVRVLARRLMRRVMARHRRPDLRRINMVIDARGAEVLKAERATAFPLWLRLMTTTPRGRILIPLRQHAYARNRQGTRRRMVQVSERPDGALVFGLVTDVGEVFRAQRDAYEPAVDQVALDFGLRTLFATDRGDLLGRGFMTRLAKADRRITGLAAHLQRMGRRPSSSKKYRREVVRLRGFIRTEVNRVLNRVIERDRPGRLVLERLRFQAPGLSRRMNRLLQNCGRSVIQEKLKDIEEKYGVTATIVNAAYTSQECSACGYVDASNRDGERFACRWCRKQLHADVNAARTIGQRRSLSIGSGFVTKAQVLESRLKRFLERQPRLRQGRPGLQGKPADPRLNNPYFREWSATVTSILPDCAATYGGAGKQ